jgi:amino acid transporter
VRLSTLGIVTGACLFCVSQVTGWAIFFPMMRGGGTYTWEELNGWILATEFGLTILFSLIGVATAILNLQWQEAIKEGK